MTVAGIIAVALTSGLAATLAAPRWPRPATAVGLLGAGLCLVLAATGGAGDVVAIGGVTLAGSGDLGLVALGWSATALVLGAAGLVTGAARFTVGPGVLAMGSAVLALAVDDPGVAFGALAAGGAAAVAVPALGGWLADRDSAPPTAVAMYAAAATVGPGLAGLLLVAVARSTVGSVGRGSIDVGSVVALVVLGLVATVVIRSGAIPAHLWAARLIGAVSPLAIPAALAWGSTAFTLVALAWARSLVTETGYALDDVGLFLVILAAIASIALGGLAAILHDDIEHVMWYSIVQDAGVALLAFATLRPDAVAAARDWLVAMAVLTSALAGWMALARWAFGVHRVSELRGWARRSPGLAATAVVILLGSIGVPGMAIFEARLTLASGALPGLLGTLLAVVALSPLVAIGRILAAGVARPTPEVSAAPRERLGVVIQPTGGWSRGGWSRGGVVSAIRTAQTTVRDNEVLIAVVATGILAAIGLVLAVVGTGGAGAAVAPAGS